MATYLRPLETPKTQRTPTTARRPLENGEHLTRAEFHTRYAAMPDDVRAELVEGVVYMTSPARRLHVACTSPARRLHSQPHAMVMTWLGVYMAATPGVEALVVTTVLLDPDNEVEPDALLRIDTACGGQSRVDEDGYIAGPPELVVEIAATSTAYDLHEKKNAYRRNGVREYVVWRVYDGALDWFTLEAGRYGTQAPDEHGVCTSRVFPGLRLAGAALLAGDR
jgi:Uma2 family endonuclease